VVGKTATWAEKGYRNVIVHLFIPTWLLLFMLSTVLGTKDTVVN